MKNNYRTLFAFVFLLTVNINLAQVSLVKNISTNAKTSSITSTSIGLIFGADDNPTIINQEPFISDGTESGTIKLKEINTNNVFSNASSISFTDSNEFVELNGYVYFAAGTASNNVELWRTDGTSVGTTLVKEINASSASSGSPSNFIVNNGLIYFSASNGIAGSNNGRELWISDGTTAGTILLKDIYPGTDSSNPTDFVVHDGKVFFTADNGPNGRELWVTDGTNSGTQLVKDFVAGTGSSNPKFTTSYNGDLYFSANGELYKSNGIIGNGGVLKNINAAGNSNPSGFTIYNNRLYFTADDGINGRELWRTNGTVFGTELFLDINPTGNSDANSFTVANGLLYFNAKNGTNGRELWLTDGLVANTDMIEISGIAELNPAQLITYNSKVYFFGNNSNGNRKLWSSNGTVSGTSVLNTPNIINEYKMSVYNNQLYFSAVNLYKYQDPSLSLPSVYLAKLELYPNPSRLYFELKGIADFDSLEIFDVSGKLIKQYFSAQQFYPIPNLDNGLYMVKVTSNNQAQTLKLIKK